MPISPVSQGEIEKIEKPKKYFEDQKIKISPKFYVKNPAKLCFNFFFPCAPSLFSPQIIEISLVHVHTPIGTGASLG